MLLKGAYQLAASQTIFAVDHLLRNLKRLENDYTSFSERFGPYLAECKENFGLILPSHSTSSVAIRRKSHFSLSLSA